MTPVPVPSLDLAALAARLRRAGFRVDTRQYLTAHELLLAHAASGTDVLADRDRLIHWLAPIFCTSPDEQETFAKEVNDWLGARPPTPTPAPPEPEKADRPAQSPFRLWRRSRWWQRALMVLVPIALMLAALAAWYTIPVTVRGIVRVQQPASDGKVRDVPGALLAKVRFQVDGQAAAIAANGEFSVRVSRSQSRSLSASLDGFQPLSRTVTGTTTEHIEMNLVPVPVSSAPRTGGVSRAVASPNLLGLLLSDETAERELRWPIVIISAFLTSVAAFGVLWITGWLRHRLAIRRLPLHGDPESVTLPVPATPVLPVSEQELNRVAIALRQPREGVMRDLDVPATVQATARDAGFFAPRFSSRKAMPEYVVLVSRRHGEDHQARIFDTVFRYLHERDVTVDTYSFKGDPRTCRSDQSKQTYSLRDVLNRHHRATVIVCGETLCAFNQITQRLLPWVESFRPDSSRIFLTPEPPDRWTEREARLEHAGFMVLPATPMGWRVLGGMDGASQTDPLFPAPYSRAYPASLGAEELRWLDRNEPPPDRVKRLLRDLAAYLGPDGFTWLTACAIYPEITWPLTLRLRGGVQVPAVLPSLARLPWFRHAFMPDWLRDALVKCIPDDHERRLRDELERLLAELARGSRRTDQGSTLEIGRWIGPVDLMLAAPGASPLQDRVFLGFMTGAHDPLSVSVPAALRRLFTRRPGAFDDERERQRLVSGRGAGDGLDPSDGQGTPRSIRARVGIVVKRVLGRIRFWAALRPEAARLVASTMIGLLSIGLLTASPLKPLVSIPKVIGAQDALWFAEIPEGPFRMAAFPDDVVNLRAFFISRTEVKVSEYQACVDAGACTGPTPASGTSASPDDWPVHGVTWIQAMQYCNWLNAKLRRLPNATGAIADALAGRRGDGILWRVSLPSEAEWEKAASGGVRQTYPWGDNAPDPTRANYLDLGRGPMAVGSFPNGMTPDGVMDMAGNVAEWTRTISNAQYAAPYRPDDGREILVGGPGRVFRGGSYLDDEDALRIAARNAGLLEMHDARLGFRIVIAPVGASALPPSKPVP